MTAPLAPVTPGHLQRFREDGFFILDAVVAPQDLHMLRGEAQQLLSRRDAEMDRLGTDRLGLDHRGRRYFIPAYHDSPAARQFLVSGLMARIAAAVLGPAAWLFNEQYVIKAAEHGMRFSWHQDSGFIDYPHQPTCCPTRGPAPARSSRTPGTSGPATWSATPAKTPASPSSPRRAASPASPAPPCTAAGPTPPTSCAGSTSPSTPPSRSSPKTAPGPATSPSRCPPPKPAHRDETTQPQLAQRREF